MKSIITIFLFVMMSFGILCILASLDLLTGTSLHTYFSNPNVPETINYANWAPRVFVTGLGIIFFSGMLLAYYSAQQPARRRSIA